MEQRKYRARTNHVLLRLQQRDRTRGGVVIPEKSSAGKDFIVVSYGPDVEDLQIGDKVLVSGMVNADYFPLPEEKDLIVTQDKNVILIVEEEG